MSFDPFARLGEPLTLPDGAVIPPGGELPRGVFDRDGKFCDIANIRRDVGHEIAFELRPYALRHRIEERLRGRYLYGGQLNHHFGHFLCETLARLWAAPLQQVEAILLLPRRKGSPRELSTWQQALFNLCGLNTPIRVVDRPLIMDELVVPAQGWGIGSMSAGAPEFRRFIRERFARGIRPEGPANLFITRENLKVVKGGMLGEHVLSENLIASGFEPFAPERHSIETQIARYKAARRIISVEGSALHLAGLVGDRNQRYAIISRRGDGIASASIAEQIRYFCGAEAIVIDHLLREWDIREGVVRSSHSVAALDFPLVRASLAANGFIENIKWRKLRRDPQSLVDEIRKRSGNNLLPIVNGQRPGPITS